METGLSPLMGVSCPTTRNAGDGEGKGKGHMRGVAVGSEADTSALKNGNGGQGQICARFPRSPYSKRGVVRDDIARTLFPGTVATVSAGTTNQTIHPRRDRFDGVHRADKDPDLDHVACFPVVRRGFETRRDNHTVAIFVENESVHRAPPFVTVNRTLRPVVSFGPDGYPMNAPNSTREKSST